MIKRTGAYTIAFESQPVIAGWGVGCRKKGSRRSPLKTILTKLFTTAMTAVTPFEQAESMFQGEALEKSSGAFKNTRKRG